ncbi:hypothetical protein LEMLEM_LOCUS11082, partial [Lemmus lemmus]
MEAERSVSDAFSEERWFHNRVGEGDKLGLHERYIVKTEHEVCADGLNVK